jgi:hypothetical protein
MGLLLVKSRYQVFYNLYIFFEELYNDIEIKYDDSYY